MKILLVFLLFVLVVCFTTVDALGCTCMEFGVPVCAEIQRADTIFTGTVKAIKLNGGTGMETSAISFSAEEVYKGSIGPSVDVGYTFGTSCSWLRFEVGQRWIVYGYKDPSTGRLSIPFCTGSHEYESSSQDLSVLNNFKRGNGGESIRGRIKSAGEVANNPVVISGDKVTLRTKTNHEGLFDVSVPAPGKYKVTVSVPFSAMLMHYDPTFQLSDVLVTESESGLTYEANVEKGLCSYTQLEFSKVDLKATASITGRLLDSDGKPTKGFLHLQKWHLDEKHTLKGGEFASADEDGVYTFDGL